MAFVPGDLAACFVPVFRYALERWVPDPYRVEVFHRGPLSEEHQRLLNRLDSSRAPSETSVNLNLDVTWVDLADAPADSEAVDGWRAEGAETLPWMHVYFPWSRRAEEPSWAGPLTDAIIDRLVDSPVRRELARRLLTGESAVWVLLESGDAIRDDQARQQLNSRLEYLTTTLELPVLNPADIEQGLISIDEDQLKIAFSTIRLSRQDPAEEFLVRMLLGSEDDLGEFDEPMAFPVFGRGRVLYALVGAGIASDVIDEACVYLTGECSCEIKEQNPGVDLLMSVDWDRLVTTHSDIDRELPPLSGFVGVDGDSAVDASLVDRTASPPGAASLAVSVDYSDVPASDNSEITQGMSPPVFNALLFCTIGGCGVLATGMFLLRTRPNA